MILLLEILAVLAVVFGVAVVLTGRSEGLSDEGRDLADTGIPRDRAMTPADVVGLRFALAFRGYRMDEVDDALDRLAAELAARDEAIARLRAPAAPVAEPEAPAWAPASEPEPEADEVPTWAPPAPIVAPPAPPAPEPATTLWPEEPAPVEAPPAPPEPAETANPFRPEVPDIPAYDPWAVTPRSRYTDGPEYVEVEHPEDTPVEQVAEHQSGYAPEPEPEPEPAAEAEPDEPPAPPTWPS